MALSDTAAIDALGIEEDSGDLVLALLDDMAWDDPAAHWERLTAKLDAYLNFLVSGEVREHHPDAETLAKRIHVVFRHEPPETIAAALAKTREFVDGHGVALVWDVHGE